LQDDVAAGHPLGDAGRFFDQELAVHHRDAPVAAAGEFLALLKPVAEKPDVLWERADLERFYAKLENEYELKERADLLTRKLTVISDTAMALADIINTERSLRLERIIIALILIGTIFGGYQLFVR